MANIFLNLPAPAANGAGAAVNVSTMGGPKTVTVAGNGGVFEPSVTIEVALDAGGTEWTPIWTFLLPGEKTFTIVPRWMRAVVSNYKGGGAPTVDVGSDDSGSSFANLAATAGDGSGASTDTSALGLLRTVQVGGSFRGAANIEISNDGVNFQTAFSFQSAGGVQTQIFAAEFMRVTRTGVPINSPGLPIVNVGAVDLGGGGGGGGIDVEDEGIAVPNGPFSTLNFIGAVVASDAGGGVANVTIPGNGGTVGPGTPNTIAKFDGVTSVGDSSITDDGLQVEVTAATLLVDGNLTANNALSTLYQTIIQGYFARQSAIAPAALAAGTTNDYAPAGMTGASRIRQATNAANSALSGLVSPGVNGNEWLLVNLGPGTLTLLHDDAGSAAANRFTLEGGVNRVIGVGGMVLLTYDNTTARWYCIG